MMTKLSPQAQAVLDAIQDELDATAELVPCTERIAAAALRVAADQLDVTNGECPGVTPFEIGFLKGAARCQRDLLAIADELEAT